MTTRILMIALSVASFCALAAPPDPPAGKRWVLNEAFSDEFNSTQLDHEKWYDYHPKWKGRPPGLFVPENVSVGGGFLKLRGGVLDDEVKIGKYVYSVTCAAVTSKSYEASFGYYECRFKASKCTLSTTFWLSTRKAADGPLDCKDRYGLELDIQECIGRTGDFKGNVLATGMNANGHFWYTDCDRQKHNLVARPSVKFRMKKFPSEDFNIYGCWWRDESRATFYLNNNEGRDMTFYAGIKEKPFDLPMAMNLVSETYSSPWITLPSREELLDPARCTSYYDWVRSYVLVAVDKAGQPPPYDVFPAFLRIDEESSSESRWKTLTFVYSCNRARTVLIEVKDVKGLELFRTTRVLQPGLGKVAIPLPVPRGLDLGGKSRIRISYEDSEKPVEATARMARPAPGPAPAKPVVLWNEDFEGVKPGAVSGINQTLAGTKVQTSHSLSGQAVKAPAEFTTATGNVIRLSTGVGKWSSICPPQVMDLSSLGIREGDRYRISLDYYIPKALARGIGSVMFKWESSEGASQSITYNSCERRAAGVWRVDYSGTFPVQTRTSSFMPAKVLPLIRFDQGGAAAAGLAYVDNIRFAIEPRSKK